MNILILLVFTQNSHKVFEIWVVAELSHKLKELGDKINKNKDISPVV